MISFITQWAEQIIVALIIVIIFELIIPEGKNKKYIKLVMGVFILYTIINPVTGDKVKNISFNEILEQSNTSLAYSNNISSLSLDNNVEQVYEENIILSISNTLEEQGYDAKNVNVKINYEEGDYYGTVEAVEMNVSKKMRMIII